MLYAILIRLSISLLAGFLLVRRFRAPLRSAIVRAMPLNARLSEDAFKRQARLSNIIGLSLWLLIAALLFIGSGYVLRSWRPDESVRMELSPLPAEPTGREPAVDLTEPEPEAVPEPKAMVPAEPPEPEAGNKPPQQRPATRPAPAVPTLRTVPYYLQIGAFQEAAYARRYQYLCASKLGVRVRLGHDPGSWAPYKVLLGPFRSRRQAERYRRQQKLKGFPRPLEDILLYQAQ